jgi:hypothetical protein
VPSTSSLFPVTTVPITASELVTSLVWVALFSFAFLLLLLLTLSFSLLSFLIQLLLRLLHAHLRLLEVGRKSRVCAVLAGLAIWAETGQVERADLVPFVVLQRTVWAERTEATVVVRARRSLGLGVNVQVEAVVAVRARQRAGVVRALWHATKVVLVQELACLPLLAESAQPVLADQAIVRTVSRGR